MKALIALCLLALSFQVGFCKKNWDWERKTFSFLELDENEEKEEKDENIEEMQEIDDIMNMLKEDEDENTADHCTGVHCGPGRECTEGKCTCVKECSDEKDARRWVCSNQNQTYKSDCTLYRSRCWCEENSQHCEKPENRHLHVEYYGECRDIGTCSEDEIVDFPRRMRDWLFSVMKDLSERAEISEKFKPVNLDNSQSTRWSVAAVWKWCDLDKHPHDNIVSRHELFPLRAPLHSLERCISPFLDSCDTDNDHSITIQEWADCLELDIEDFILRCEDI
ncbi:SPARC [Eurytemora carolleeae]|uniref:SPARC n=1 Tax=Eurytemora carolleeae TaxID=1294199 RepID=UPI000C77482D|nr:SPARC [Eurytemora carolleeae]|eukprot:XP_023326031.1 SPARC-like [Eurytemora affinis]